MTFLNSFKEELAMEAEGTRKMLALVPFDKLDWAPHTKSMKMGDLATHIADIPNWIGTALKTDYLDFAESPYQPKKFNSSDELVAYFNKNENNAQNDLSNYSDDILSKIWELKDGGQVFMTLTKLQTIRHAFCQMVHHRAQLGVYLRLLDIPIPGVYGPSADEMQH